MGLLKIGEYVLIDSQITHGEICALATAAPSSTKNKVYI